MRVAVRKAPAARGLFAAVSVDSPYRSVGERDYAAVADCGSDASSGVGSGRDAHAGDVDMASDVG